MITLPKEAVVIRISNQIRFQRSLIVNLKSITPAVKTFLINTLNAAEPAFEADPRADHVYVTRHDVKLQYAKSKPNISTSSLSDSTEPVESFPSDALVARRLSELQKLQVAVLVKASKDPSYFKYSDFYRQNLYILEDIAPLASLPALPSYSQSESPSKRATRSLVLQQRELFENSSALLLLSEPSKISVHIHDGLFNGIIDAAQRMSHKDPRSETIEAKLTVAGSPLTVVATCSSAKGSEIMMLSDQRAERCIRNYCQKEILARKAELIARHGEQNFKYSDIPNFFVIDIEDLAVLMGMSVTSVNLDSIAAMMKRLNETTFKVDASQNQWFKDVFSLTTENKPDTYEFRFLQGLSIAYDKVQVDDLFKTSNIMSRPRFYSFSLDFRTFISLCQTRHMIFLSHPDLVTERSGVIQRFSNWTRAFVGSRDKAGLNNTWYTIQDLHKKLLPSSRFDNFKTHFIRALKKFVLKPSTDEETTTTDEETTSSVKETVSLVYGYYVYQRQRAGTYEYRFARDPNDPYVGDQSTHNLLVRKNLLSDLAAVINPTEDRDDFIPGELVNESAST